MDLLSYATISDGATLTAEERQAAEETTMTYKEVSDETGNFSDNSSSSSDDADEMNIRKDAELQSRSLTTLPRSSSGTHTSRADQNQTKLGLGNDSWELLKGDPETEEITNENGHIDQYGSVSSWKSARNGGRQVIETTDATNGSLC